ncbi:fatty acid hydroxylase [Nocardioides silvaticus]|uniref:Fatty acid hydroxylase n=1 Tax=Nocardioides silvaticus TaxID=2201891 RepID=A0A316TGG7_9ACTN|nr:sterol desaturase family protein [Nocardioides silvaticus]PWN02581.1 fatty acid hydroxylase [Nocardioides silvaticus]
MTTKNVEELAKRQVARDEARITGDRRTSQSMRQVFVEFWKHPSPYILSTYLLAAVVGRVLAGPGEWWELLLPVGLIAIMPVVEWVIHVFILHWKPRRIAGIKIDPLLSRKHRAHHRDPRAIPLVFIPWQVELTLGPLGLLVAWAVTPTWTAAFSLLVANLVLLSAYEWTHYLLHSDYRPKSRWYRSVWRNHRLHHYKSEHYWFTVTTAATADRLFGTYPDPATVPTSPTARNLHGLDS